MREIREFCLSQGGVRLIVDERSKDYIKYEGFKSENIFRYVVFEGDILKSEKCTSTLFRVAQTMDYDVVFAFSREHKDVFLTFKRKN